MMRKLRFEEEIESKKLISPEFWRRAYLKINEKHGKIPLLEVFSTTL